MRGKYSAPRKRRVHPIFWIIFLVFLVLGSAVLIKTLNPANDPQSTTPQTQHTEPPQLTTESTTAPTQVTVTEPATTPTTEPATEPSTEPSTEPTEPTEPSTVPEEDDPDAALTLGEQIVAVARTAIGKPYLKGGAGPDGFETSGLISYCFKACGVSVPRRTSAQFAHGEAVEKENLQPGDVVFFYMETPGSADYMGIYTGENTFITVSSSANAVIERKLNSSYYKEHYVDARRYIPTEETNP